MEWKQELKYQIEAANKILFQHKNRQVSEAINLVANTYPMRVTKHYLSLIDLENPNDPLYKMTIPDIIELDEDGLSDTSGEKMNTVLQGVQHKYAQTLLILSTNQCATYCRHCFRKRMVGVLNDETNCHVNDVASYLKNHKVINNVLISGGDALLNDTKMIKEYLDCLTEIDQIKYVRLGTRVLATFPQRILYDDELLEVFREYSSKKAINIMTQFNHKNEFTIETYDAVKLLQQNGVNIYNQTVLLKGINDNVEVLSELMRKIVQCGIKPYYIFQCRPVKGVKNRFQVPLVKGCDLIDEVRSSLSGLEKSFRYIMSNQDGKIEIVGRLQEDKILFKYHQAREICNRNRLFTKKITDNECWL